MLLKLLRQNISIPQFAGYAFAALAGMSIIFAAFCFSRDIRPLFEHSSGLFKPDLMIVNKKVTFGSLYNSDLTTFSENEIEEIKQQSFVKSLAHFTTARFRVHATTPASGDVPEFFTEMFFESVPDELIDIDLTNWKWNPETDDIPIIIPGDYLNLYNFGFAGSQGLPQISKEIAQQVTFRVFISGNRRPTEEFRGRIAGFSAYLNTILVPENFMKWANEHFGNGEPGKISRLIIETHNPADPKIVEFFGSKDDYDLNNKDEQGKLSFFLKLLITIVMAVGVLIMLPATGLMLLSINLLVYKNQKILGNLILLGYQRRKLALPYCCLTLALNVFVGVSSFLITGYAQNLYGRQLQTMGIADLSGLQDTAAFATIFVLLVTLLNVLWIQNKIKTIKIPSRG